MSMVKQVRKRTPMQSLVQIAVYCNAHAGELEGRTFRSIANTLRERFPVVITDKAIRQVIEAANIRVDGRGGNKRGYTRSRNLGEMATVLLNVVTRIEKEFGLDSLLTDEERQTLTKSSSRKTAT